MFGIGFQEMLIILVVVLIFFGPKRLPDLAKSLGKGIAEFKKASEEVRKGIEEAVKEESPAEDRKPPEVPPVYANAPGTAPSTQEPATRPGAADPPPAPPEGEAPKDTAPGDTAATDSAKPTATPRPG
jgi:TatA/E family protein of Tat protein translocase